MQTTQMSKGSHGFGMVIVLLLACGISRAQDKKPSADIHWEDGPTVGKLGDIAQITVPEHYSFTGKEGALKVMEITQNPASGKELGVLIPLVKKGERNWFVIFEFESTGYVKDDEKNELNADAILKSLKEGTEESNKVRQQKGWKAYHVVGWSKPPFYNDASHNLTWAISGQEEGSAGQNVNYSVRILGRRGTMNADLMLATDLVPTVVPEFENLLTGFSFLPGQKYSEFRAGDKVAEYGLTALIAGGAAAAAIKSGLFAKFWKLIVLGFVALFGAIKKFFAYLKRLIKGEAAQQETTQPQG
jgi:uncharacterized membrane-anchored protein